MNIRVSDDKVEIEGYVNSLERLSKPLHDRLGQYRERIKVGAFKRALDNAEDVRILLNHDWDKDLGGIKDGNLELEEDNIGLHARATITDKDVIEQARNGKIRGWSFGFKDKDVDKTEENGVIIRNVNDLELYEVSLINEQKIPAYDGTLINVRTKDNEPLNVSDVSETSLNIRAEEPKKEEPPKDIDYTEVKKIIEELKGE